MAKSKWAEIEQARRDGMGYALAIAREKGIEGLEEEAKFRGISKVSVAMSNEEYKELVKSITADSVDAIAIIATLTLHDEFGFGEKRVKQFNCISEGFTTWQEQIEILRKECNLKLGEKILKGAEKK